MPPWTVHDHFDEFIKLAAFLIEMEQWRKQEWWREEKAISTTGGGEEKAVEEVKEWMCLGVMGCRDNKREGREDEGSSYRLCNINLWCRDKKKKDRWALRVKAGFPLVENECRARYWKSCHLWTRTELFSTCICLAALPKSLKSWPGAQHVTPRIRYIEQPSIIYSVRLLADNNLNKEFLFN